MAEAPHYKCYRCGENLAFIQQYQRWYCAKCQQYMPSAQDHHPQQYGYIPQYVPQYVPQYAPQYSPYYSYAAQPPPPPPPMGHSPWPQGFPSPSAEAGLNRVKESLRNRREDDRIVSPIWVWVLFFATLSSTVILLFLVLAYLMVAELSATTTNIFFAALAVSLFVLYALKYAAQAVVVYRLVERRDRHFRRDQQTRSGIVEYLTARNSAAQGTIGMEVATLNALHSFASPEEGKERGSIVWALLCAIPIIDMVALLIVLNMLTKEAYAHDTRQRTFYYHVRLAFARLGEPLPATFEEHALKERPAGLYLVISIVTIPALFIFSYYWLYATMKDWNAHFEAQWRFEDSLLSRAGK